MANGLPKCPRKSCAGNRSGVCLILKTNNFGDKDCPFFKTKEQVAEENRRIKTKLIFEERYDILDRYYGGVTDGC